MYMRDCSKTKPSIKNKMCVLSILIHINAYQYLYSSFQSRGYRETPYRGYAFTSDYIIDHVIDQYVVARILHNNECNTSLCSWNLPLSVQGQQCMPLVASHYVKHIAFIGWTHTSHNDYHNYVFRALPTARRHNKLADTELPCTAKIGLTGIAEVAAVDP